MPKSKIILALGFFIALMPVLGFPYSWEVVFQVFAGLSIVFLSVMISVDKRLMLKAKVQKRQLRKRAIVDSMTAAQNPEVYGRRATDITPGAVQFGRRAEDKAVLNEEENSDI